MRRPLSESEQQQRREPSPRSVYIKNGSSLGVTASLIEGGRPLGDAQSFQNVAELGFGSGERNPAHFVRRERIAPCIGSS
jgi:hypothetical protein